ncbi:MAG: hypothetical protein IPN06_09135 [Burkholderiales bacterium]|jgi:hypothetical protein|nr:hypothetical protein [Burkholderiales bacterium]
MTTSHHVNEPPTTYGTLPGSAPPDIRGSLLAIRRAAQRARLVAQQTGTDLIVMRAGQVVRVASGQKTGQ